jgi:hypothetical protein
METCHHLRRRVLAYVAEHYDGDIEDEPTLHAALESVLGPRPQEPADENPDVLDAAGEMVRAVENAGEPPWDWATRDARTALGATVMFIKRDGLTLESLIPTQHAQVRRDMVAHGLVNCKDGAMDATSALYRLMDDDGDEVWEDD